MLYKYLNPNIVLVTAEGEETVTSQAKGKQLYKYLIPNIVHVTVAGEGTGASQTKAKQLQKRKPQLLMLGN